MSRETAAKKKKTPHAGEMTPQQQIRRLVKQRNALWKFIDEHIVMPKRFKHADEGTTLSDKDVIGHGTTGVCMDDAFVMIHRELWDELAARYSEAELDRLYEDADAIVDNTYAIEGINPATGDDCPDVPEDVRNLYDVSKPWR